ncbi:FMN-binding negative transcriptional regulator [Chitinophagaceae bacterium MMS25-I14]
MLVTNGSDGRPRGTHLPFHMDVRGEELVLTAHMAKANPQWKELEGQELLVIFSGPHAYISPSLYEKHENVPTWNYLAVHAYGQAALVTDKEKGMALLEDMMRQSEPAYLKQWAEQSEDYKDRLYKGIVPFEIKVHTLQGKQKLSQNKTEAERSNIAASLQNSDDTAAQDIAAYMQRKP